MMVSIALTYLLTAFYFVMERLQRKSKQALSLQAGPSDRGSSRFLISGLIEIAFLLLAPVLNMNGWGLMQVGAAMNWIGILIMLGGLTLRYFAAKTLGELYTRMLLVVPEQAVIEQGPYKVIRHPGYLGVLLGSVGAGLATANWIVLVTVMLTKFIGIGYRIYSEEKMLLVAFSEEYSAYRANTYRLIPFIL